MNPNITPREALTLLDRVGQNFSGNRQDHVNIQQAIQTLDMLVRKDEALTNFRQAEPTTTTTSTEVPATEMGKIDTPTE